ncbi:MAG TPA: cupin domain-containing protein, partial [Vicinamibacterales bacterium]
DGNVERAYTARMKQKLLLALAIALAASGADWGFSALSAQAIGGPEKGRPVTGDPGISSMVVMDRPDFRVLRDWAEPGAVRRMHNHADATYHVFTLLTGQLTLTIEGEQPVEVKAGDVVELKGGAMHTFKNTGNVTATIVEVFGKARKP